MSERKDFEGWAESPKKALAKAVEMARWEFEKALPPRRKIARLEFEVVRQWGDWHDDKIEYWAAIRVIEVTTEVGL